MQTGKYAANVGLTWPVFPASPSGLPQNVPTMAEVLKQQGYKTAISGKWHLGNAQWKQTPVGRGFDVHVGSQSWGISHFTKQFYQQPVIPLVTDWVESYSNGTYNHYVDTKHSTDAVTDAAVDMMKNHASANDALGDAAKRDPMFLYVAYIAAHSPLQPLQSDLDSCQHISHIWRRQYCGLMVGLDRGVKTLMENIKKYLGRNTIVVITSDNGGSTWFGGMNTPYRGEKMTPMQGGVLMPAILLDLSPNELYIGDGRTLVVQQYREFNELMHVSDWFPTLLGLSGLPYAEIDDLSNLVRNMDGVDLSSAIRNVASVENSNSAEVGLRDGMLIDMFYEGESPFFSLMEAYIYGDMKYIRGVIPDSLWYRETEEGCAMLNYRLLPDESLVVKFSRKWFLIKYIKAVLWLTESLIQTLEMLLQSHYGSLDTMKLYLTHSVVAPHIAYSMHEIHANDDGDTGYYLFNLTADPYETKNLNKNDYADIVSLIEERLSQIRSKRPEQQKYWMQLNPFKTWPRSFVSAGWGFHTIGSSASYKDRSEVSNNDGSRFIHPWYGDNLDDSELFTHDDLLVSSIGQANKLFLMRVFYAALFGAFVFQLGYFYVSRN